MSGAELATKQDLEAGLAGVRGEMGQMREGLRGEMRDMAETLRGEIKEMAGILRGELRDMAGKLREETQAMGARIVLDLTNVMQDFKNEIINRLDGRVFDEAVRAKAVEDSLAVECKRNRKALDRLKSGGSRLARRVTGHERRIKNLESGRYGLR